MKIFITILCFVISCHTFAQEEPIRFGDIPMEDMKMAQYDLDSSAAALVLTDFGQSTIRYNQTSGFSIQFERILRIKILSKDGLDWATVSVPLYHDDGADEKFSALRASTFNLENGKIVETKMKGDATFKEKVNENLNVIKFTLPVVRQGSIIEVTYKVMSDFMVNFQGWNFQSTIPTRWSEYRTAIPEYFHYEKFLQGYVPMAISESKLSSDQITLTHTWEAGSVLLTTGSETDYEHLNLMVQRDRWVAKDVRAFKVEPYMTTYKDYISRMNFELAYVKYPSQPPKPYMGSWEDINRKYYGSASFGGEVMGNGFLKKIVEEVTAGKTTPEEKIAAINNYVKRNVDWNGFSHKFAENTFKNVLEAKKGSSAEVNLLLASMLEKADIDISPVLISTRDHGVVRETVPVSSQFNYVICMARLGDRFLLLDATDPLLATGVLPERCLNGRGLVIGESGFNWVSLTPKTRSRNMYNADLVMTPEGELAGKIKFERTGYFARESREKYLAKGEGEYVKDAIANRSWTVAKSEFVNAKDISENFKEIHEVTITDHLTGGSNVMYLSPFIDMQEKENPFKSPTREYPVDFGSPIEKLYMCKIAIPDGFVVDEMPQSNVFKLGENARYTYNIAKSGNMLNLTSHLIMYNSMFPQTEYTQLREFYDLVVAKQAEQIVLKKK